MKEKYYIHHFRLLLVITVCPKLKFTNLTRHDVSTHFIKIELPFLKIGKVFYSTTGCFLLHINHKKRRGKV